MPERKKPKNASGPAGTGEKSSTNISLDPIKSPLSMEILRVANAIHMMTVFYSPAAVIGGAITAACELLMGRPIDADKDNDIEPFIRAICDHCMSKREVKREDATSVAPEPKRVM